MRRHGLFHHLACSLDALSPIPANPNTTAAIGTPMARNPHRPRPRRNYPTSGGPSPPATVPGPTARRPHHSWPRSPAPCLEPGRRWHSRRYQPCIGRRRAAESRPWPETLRACAKSHPGGQQADENNQFSLSHISSKRSFPTDEPSTITRSANSSMGVAKLCPFGLVRRE